MSHNQDLLDKLEDPLEQGLIAQEHLYCFLDMAFLSAYQRKKLKEHKYRSEGVSLFEQLFLKRFWRWLVMKFPMWVAPNTITLTGFVIMIFTTFCVLLQDLNCEGKVLLKLHL